VAALAILFVLLVGLPAAAESPSPAAPSASAPVTTPGPSTSTAPCPNPTAPPTPTPDPAATPTPANQTPVPQTTIAPNLCPAVPGSDFGSTLAWAFTPIFQAIFLGLVLIYNLVGDIGVAIILVTVAIRLLLVPMFRRQIVSTRRMQAVQPELKALQARYKSDKQRLQQEQMRFYKERGVNPLAGCLPSLLQLFLLMPMYSVFSSGLSAPDISSMLHILGFQVIDAAQVCQAAINPGVDPCLNPHIAWLGGLDASQKEIFFELPKSLPLVGGFGLSSLAIFSALLQLVQTRMMTPESTDPQTRAQARVFLIMPLFSVVYGAFLPSGLFIYWITTTIFSIVQQYLIAGFGALFPLFGWTPSYVTAHQPRFPVMPAPAPNTLSDGTPTDRRSAADRAAGTVRPSRERARTSRRGRRR
jgi:YidC/Oxa1 family membrane protein insertase